MTTMYVLIILKNKMIAHPYSKIYIEWLIKALFHFERPLQILREDLISVKLLIQNGANSRYMTPMYILIILKNKMIARPYSKIYIEWLIKALFYLRGHTYPARKFDICKTNDPTWGKLDIYDHNVCNNHSKK